MNDQLTPEELEIIAAVESGKVTSLPDLEQRKKQYSEYAANTVAKNKRVNIRISERDLMLIQKKALEEGLPYQTLISSLLHKYINGRLVERN